MRKVRQSSFPLTAVADGSDELITNTDVIHSSLVGSSGSAADDCDAAALVPHELKAEHCCPLQTRRPTELAQ